MTCQPARKEASNIARPYRRVLLERGGVVHVLLILEAEQRQGAGRDLEDALEESHAVPLHAITRENIVESVAFS